MQTNIPNTGAAEKQRECRISCVRKRVSSNKVLYDVLQNDRSSMIVHGTFTTSQSVSDISNALVTLK